MFAVPQRDARELSDQVRLLVRHRRAAQHGERVAAVLGLDPSNGVDRAIERLIPCGFAKASMRADQRRQQTVGMFVLQIAFDALWAQHSVIDRKLFPRLEAHDLVVLDLELNAALHAAETAVRLHQLVRLLLLPAAGRLVVQVRAVPVDELISSRVGIAMLSSAAQRFALIQRQQASAAWRADVLVVNLPVRRGKAKIESELSSTFFRSSTCICEA